MEKQRLHIKSFYGTSQNAVFSQIWIAIYDYLQLAIAKKCIMLINIFISYRLP